MKKIIGIGLVLMLLVIAGCELEPERMSTQQDEQELTETNQQMLIKNQPAPLIAKSLERENLIRRIQLMNDENKVFYVYLVNYGKIMAYFTARGKVSSLNSYLTNYEQIVGDKECIRDLGENTNCYFPVEAPDLDGTYGQNPDGIFFFTTENTYVEWHGDFMVSDFPLKLTQPPELVKNVV